MVSTMGRGNITVLNFNFSKIDNCLMFFKLKTCFYTYSHELLKMYIHFLFNVLPRVNLNSANSYKIYHCLVKKNYSSCFFCG